MLIVCLTPVRWWDRCLYRDGVGECNLEELLWVQWSLEGLLHYLLLLLELLLVPFIKLLSEKVIIILLLFVASCMRSRLFAWNFSRTRASWSFLKQLAFCFSVKHRFSWPVKFHAQWVIFRVIFVGVIIDNNFFWIKLAVVYKPLLWLMPDGFSVCTNNGELWPAVFEDFGCCWWFLGHHFHGRAWGRSKGTGLDVVRVLPVLGFFANQGRFLNILLQTRIRLLLHKKLHLSVYPWKQAAIFDKEVFLDEFAAALTPLSGQYELPFLFVVHLAKQRLLLCLSIL